MIPFVADRELAEKRIAICEDCNHFRKRSRTCGTPIIGDKVGDKRTCGCFMDAKTKLSFSTCPLDFWGSLQVSHSDYLEMKKLLDEVKHSINADQKVVLYKLRNKYFGGNLKTSNCSPCLKSALNELQQIIDEYEK